MGKIDNLSINKEKIKKMIKLLLPFILVTTMTACQTKKNSSDDKNIENQESQETEQVEIIENSQEETLSDENKDNNNSSSPETNENVEQKDESTVVSYFNNLQNEFEQVENFDSDDVKKWAFDKLKSTVDFVTNKEPIGNIYFKDLTGTAKGTVIGTLTYIDEKLMALCPDYKDRAANIFNKAKDELSEFKQTVEKSIGEQIGEDKYNEIKSSTKEKISELKDKIKNGYSKVKEKIKKWYNDNTN